MSVLLYGCLTYLLLYLPVKLLKKLFPSHLPYQAVTESFFDISLDLVFLHVVCNFLSVILLVRYSH